MRKTGSFGRRLALLAVGGLLLFATAGAAADTLALHLVSQDNNTITLGWTPQAGYGYLFSANGNLVSRTNDPNRATVRFSKANTYEVAVIAKGATGTYPPPTPPPPKPQCSDGLDNDGDGKTDYPADTGCSSATDNDETNLLPPPVGNVVTFPATVTAATFLQVVNAAPAGPVTAMPANALATFTVTGDFTLNRQNVTIQHAVLRDVEVNAAGSGFVIEDSTIHSFYIDGASDWIIRRDNIAFNGVSYNGFGGSVMMRAKNWKILDSLITGAYVIADPSQHTESWFISAGVDGGLIQGNHFDDNGSTGHLFFSWFDFNPNGNSPDPQNICVQNNQFTRSHNPYWHIDMRSELNWATNNIDINPVTNTYDKPYTYTKLVDIDQSLRAC